MTPCDECKGKGTIALFTSVAECRACKGTGEADWLQEDHEDEWPRVPMFPAGPGLADYPPIRCAVGIAKDTGEAGDTKREYDPRVEAYTEEAGENLLRISRGARLTYSGGAPAPIPDLGPVPPSTEAQAKAAALAVPGVRRVVTEELGSVVFIRFWGGDTREVMAAVGEVRPAGVGFYLVDEGRLP